MIRQILAVFKRPTPDYGYRYSVDVPWPTGLDRAWVKTRNFDHRAKDGSLLQVVVLNGSNGIALCRDWQGRTVAGDIELWLRVSKRQWWSVDADFTVEMYTIGILAGSRPGSPMVELYGERPSWDKKVAHLAGVYLAKFDDAKRPTMIRLTRLANEGGPDPHGGPAPELFVQG